MLGAVGISPIYIVVAALITAAGAIGAAIIIVRSKKILAEHKDLSAQLREIAGITETSGNLTAQNTRNLKVLRGDLGTEEKGISHLTDQHAEIIKAIANIEKRFAEQDKAKDWLAKSDPLIAEALERVGQLAVPLYDAMQQNSKLGMQVEKLTEERNRLHGQIKKYQLLIAGTSDDEEQNCDKESESDILVSSYHPLEVNPTSDYEYYRHLSDRVNQARAETNQGADEIRE